MVRLSSTLLLAAVTLGACAGGPGGRMGSAKALQDAGATAYLCRWGAWAREV